METDRFDGKNKAEVVYFKVNNNMKLPSITELKERIIRQIKWNKESKEFRIEDFSAINIRNYILKEIVYFNIYPNENDGYNVHIYFTHTRTIYTRILLVTSIVLAFFTWGLSLLLFLVPIFYSVVKSYKILPNICESLVLAIERYNDEINNSSSKDDNNGEKTNEIKERERETNIDSNKNDGFRIAEDGTIIKNSANTNKEYQISEDGTIIRNSANTNKEYQIAEDGTIIR